MKKRSILLLIALIVSITVRSQNQSFELGLVKCLTETIQLQNDCYKMKLALRNTRIVEDPITGAARIAFDNNIDQMSNLDKKLIQKFKSLDLEHQIKILKTVGLSVFPLSSSFIIVDRNNLLTEGLEIKNAHNVFSVLRDGNINTKNSRLNLERISFRGDEIYITVSIEGENKTYQYGIKVMNGSFKNTSIHQSSNSQSFE